MSQFITFWFLNTSNLSLIKTYWIYLALETGWITNIYMRIIMPSRMTLFHRGRRLTIQTFFKNSENEISIVINNYMYYLLTAIATNAKTYLVTRRFNAVNQLK